jgi:hypothetical protein
LLNRSQQVILRYGFDLQFNVFDNVVCGVLCMRIIKFIFNWIAFTSIPVWGGIFIFITASFDIWRDKNNSVRQALNGKEWLF